MVLGLFGMFSGQVSTFIARSHTSLSLPPSSSPSLPLQLLYITGVYRVGPDIASAIQVSHLMALGDGFTCHYPLSAPHTCVDSSSGHCHVYRAAIPTFHGKWAGVACSGLMMHGLLLFMVLPLQLHTWTKILGILLAAGKPMLLL